MQKTLITYISQPLFLSADELAKLRAKDAIPIEAVIIESPDDDYALESFIRADAAACPSRQTIAIILNWRPTHDL